MQDIQRTTMDLPRELHRELRKAAFEHDRSMNSVVIDAIVNHLHQMKHNAWWNEGQVHGTAEHEV